MRTFIISAMLALAATVAEAVVKGEEVTYAAEGVTLKGYLAYNDEQKEKRPGILVVHEWWGHNEYARMRARMLDELGYTALAVDMYGDGKTAAHPSDAGKFAGEVFANLPAAKARFLAALELLKQHSTVDAGKIGAMGYCFGGGIVLAMARMGIDVKGVVSFHGSLATQQPAKRGAVKARILVCNGADDSFVPQKDIDAIKKEMKNARVNFTFKSYKGAKHAFTNPEADKFAETFNLDLAYNAEADKQSWEDMKEFFAKTFAAK